MKPFKQFLTESNALESINTSKVATTMETVFKGLKIPFKAVTANYQRVFGGAELQIRIEGVSIDKIKLDYFGIQVQQDGTVTANAKSSKLKRNYLVSHNKITKLKDTNAVTAPKGIWKDAVSAIVDDIKNSIELELI